MISACAHCGSPSVFKVEEAGEQVRLCRSCLDKQFPSMRLGLLTEALIAPKVRNGTCPNCGWTESRLNETGLLGCPLCYEAFGDHVWSKYGIERNEFAWLK